MLITSSLRIYIYILFPLLISFFILTLCASLLDASVVEMLQGDGLRELVLYFFFFSLIYFTLSTLGLNKPRKKVKKNGAYEWCHINARVQRSGSCTLTCVESNKTSIKTSKYADERSILLDEYCFSADQIPTQFPLPCFFFHF
ncbi:hypothetical protein, unlikely [Trypanosoma brucei brucei TREU927]|uniref:Uncharacterized protein n=1 Tax=Trypanosoma brucei brucei (strain 927/4 GUTat10.1) TaxID=185431 RepID=Q4GYW3_TRYB2|nr:hypothetical protein, unlikely [Trypanosoma brucei brucei TREU927]CAJ16399.1 hypothetical protein, unlikely [Trypanosoma brucei brucei TREU927]